MIVRGYLCITAALLPALVCPVNAQNAELQSGAKTLDEVAALSGTMPALIQRYTTDRQSLNDYYSGFGSFRLPLSPARDARMKQFYFGWLDTLQKLDFA